MWSIGQVFQIWAQVMGKSVTLIEDCLASGIQAYKWIISQSTLKNVMCCDVLFSFFLLQKLSQLSTNKLRATLASPTTGNCLQKVHSSSVRQLLAFLVIPKEFCQEHNSGGVCWTTSHWCLLTLCTGMLY